MSLRGAGGRGWAGGSEELHKPQLRLKKAIALLAAIPLTGRDL